MGKEGTEKSFLKKTRVYSTIIVFLLLTNISSGIWFALHLKNHTNYISQYPYIDISRSLIPQENFIVNLEPLRNRGY